MNTWAKAFHQSLRPAAKSAFEEHGPALQLGGRAGCSVALGSHVLRSLTRYAYRQGISGYVLYADISAAFYSTLVQFVAQSGSTTSQGALKRSLQGLQLPEEVEAELLSALKEPSVLTQIGVSPWLERIAAHLGENNWFLVAGDHVPVATARGTRPGSSWADVLFAFLMPRILKVRDDLLGTFSSRPLPPTIPWDGHKTLEPCVSDKTIEINDVMWADDIATPRLVAAADKVETCLRADVTAITEAFYSFGFRLSFGEHKTAAVVTLCGARSRNVKKRLFGPTELQGQLPVLLEHLPAMKLPLVAKYKHLGVMQTPSGSILEEIRFRAAQARGAFHEARRKVFKSKAIPLARKGFLLTSTVLPKLLHAAGAWPPLNHRERQLYAGTVWGFYRSILNVPRSADQHISATACFSLLQAPDPDTLLRTVRLSYLSQILRSGPDALWASIRSDQHYADLLRADVRWLYTWCWSTTSLPAPDPNWQEWFDFILQYPGKFKGMCRRAKALTVHQHTVVAALDSLHRLLRELGGFPAPFVDSADAAPKELCLPCKRSFPSRVSWAGHAARCHGYRSRAFLLPEDLVCRSCGKTYATLGRLRRHLVVAPTCVTRWGTFTPLEQSRSLKLHPLAPPTATPGTFQEAHPHFCNTMSTSLLTALSDLGECDETEVWEVIEGHIEPLDVLRNTVSHWKDSLPPHSEKAEIAENMLLLLDPAVSAESHQPTTRKAPLMESYMPTWQPLAALPLAISGTAKVWTLEPPPKIVIHPDRPTSTTVKAAAAYATWLASACDVCATCVRHAASQPVRMLCPGFATSAGPAASWLSQCGFRVDAGGFTSAS